MGAPLVPKLFKVEYWPVLPRVPLEFEWMGFDMCDLMDRAVKAIHGLHTGQKVAQSSRLKPVGLGRGGIGTPTPAGLSGR